jgi:hypothetical protein
MGVEVMDIMFVCWCKSSTLLRSLTERNSTWYGAMWVALIDGLKTMEHI